MIHKHVKIENINTAIEDILYDPQTSGGLLLSVAPEYVADIMDDFEKKNMDTKVSIIGRVKEKSEKWIRLY